ncbi:chemotaxis protein [Piscirickettsia litoralis]|uniref:Chemotaxis protein CheV n=1 Tax=Piscirickettsia litoralis TaxID=1891921 RepID=A0ABX3A0Z6_9GAMM|nr:chemotaxis protein [Piscirickettsia litoralis]ODN42123.1 hypothetical protein BGC07_03135 [Piscirickettsia litoralis]
MQNSNILADVDLKTRLAGTNRLELMLFELIDAQHTFSINVFKVREMLQCPPLTKPPGVHPSIVGVVHIRGHQFIPVIDLNKVLFNQYTEIDKYTILLITEYSQSIQGFLVNKADEIISFSWSDVYPPPESMGTDHYLTGVINFSEEKMVEIIDIERILAEIAPPVSTITKNKIDEGIKHKACEFTVVMADDSATAREITGEILKQIGVKVIAAKDGLEALKILHERIRSKEMCEQYLLVTDEEMPEMDGYTLTRKCREDKVLSGLFIILNTSISGMFNEQMVKSVGCDGFVPKTDPDLLSKLLIDRINEVCKDG